MRYTGTTKDRPVNIKTIINGVLSEGGSTPKRYSSGLVKWFNDENRLHRVDGPAILWPDGQGEWYLNGLLHRDGGPAVSDGHGDTWYHNGEVHRDDGPAVEGRNGYKSWYKHGKQHRIGGPAVEEVGALDDEYWVDDRQFTEEEYYRYVDQETGEVMVPPGKLLKYDDNDDRI